VAIVVGVGIGQDSYQEKKKMRGRRIHFWRVGLPMKTRRVRKLDRFAFPPRRWVRKWRRWREVSVEDKTKSPLQLKYSVGVAGDGFWGKMVWLGFNSVVCQQPLRHVES
jgi:hypothetical protein